MLLDLREINGGKGYDEQTLNFEHTLDLSAVRLWGIKPFVTPVFVVGRVSCRLGIYTISYTAKLHIQAVCARCLKNIERDIEGQFDHTILVDASDEDSYTDSILISGYELDLDELATSDLLLDLNTVTLCDDNCKGLCPKCGVNLNDAGCSCEIKDHDPRFDVLRKLIED